VAKDAGIGKAQGLKAVRASAASLELKWQANAKANGYIVYRYDRKKEKYTKIAKIAGGKHTSYTDEGLTKGKLYQYKVRPYKKVRGKMVYGSVGYWVKARPYALGEKDVNARQITVEDKSLTLSIVGREKAYAYVSVGKGSKTKGKKPVNKTVRWRSSNKTIATVDGKGVIKTKTGTGTCNIYAIAHNGVRAKIRVNVKDFSTPASFDFTGVQGVARDLLRDYRVELGQIARYFHIHRPPGETTFDFDEDGFTVEPEDYKISRSIQDVLCKVMGGFERDERTVIITAYKNYLTFTISDLAGVVPDGPETSAYYNVYYYYDRDMYDFDIESEDYYEIAPHWSFVVLPDSEYGDDTEYTDDPEDPEPDEA
jgi:hypothetical protein